MRRSDREIVDRDELRKIITECKVCRLAMQDECGLYIVPLNFGFSYEEGLLTLFFHSATEGRKLSAPTRNAMVAFEMDCGHALIADQEICGYGYRYKSIIGVGRAELIEEPDTKKQALLLIAKHQCETDFAVGDMRLDNVTVFKVAVTSFAGKEHK